jgi:hypothetical protein
MTLSEELNSTLRQSGRSDKHIMTRAYNEGREAFANVPNFIADNPIRRASGGTWFAGVTPGKPGVCLRRLLMESV